MAIQEKFSLEFGGLFLTYFSENCRGKFSKEFSISPSSWAAWGQAQSPFSFFRELRAVVSVERGEKWKQQPEWRQEQTRVGHAELKKPLCKVLKRSPELKDAIRATHGCESLHVESVAVKEVFEGRTYLRR